MVAMSDEVIKIKDYTNLNVQRPAGENGYTSTPQRMQRTQSVAAISLRTLRALRWELLQQACGH